jgi:hypothetical protein
VKHRFLLDINIVYYAVKGVDENRRPDETCVDLFKLILLNCHTMRMDDVVLGKYKEHLAWLQRDRESVVESLRLVISLLQNSQKAVLEPGDPPSLPQGIQVPQRDEYVVKAALMSQPTVVTSDNALKRSISENAATLGFTAVGPAEALELAKET